MSKRCCAKTCYNGQATNKFVSYLSFPKSTFYAHKWAIAAGREDLTKKPIQTMIKYCLCSEHFTDDCFIDPQSKTKLKKNRNPLRVPLPSIFKNNLTDNLKAKQSLQQTNQCSQDQNFIGFVIDKNLYNVTRLDEEQDDQLKTYTAIIENHGDVDNNENSNDMIALVLEEGESAQADELERQIYIPESNEDEYIDEFEKKICRFCGKLYEYYEMCPLFSSKIICDFIDRVMKHKIAELDGSPQSVCYKCSHEIKYCMGIITCFDSVQETCKFTNK